MVYPISVHPYLLTLYSSFLLKNFIHLDSPSKVSGIFSVEELKSLTPVPCV